MEVTRRVMGATVYEHYRFQADDGTWHVRQRTTLPDGATSLYQRPVYPDHPPVQHVEPTEQEKGPKPEIPAPRLPATEVAPDDPRVPAKARAAHDVALAHGWAVRLTAAVGPRTDQYGNIVDPEHTTMALRCSKAGGRRVIMLWEFADGEWVTPSKARVAAYSAPYQPCSHTEAKRELKA